MKNFFVVLILVSAAGKFASGATPQIIQSILTKTDDCFQCGMLEGFGYLDIKVCGATSCCVVTHINNDDVNFRPDFLDVFEGQNLKECFEFEVNADEESPIKVTIYHEGTDGLQLTFVDVVTNNKAAHCPVNGKLDADEFLEIECLG